jgi:uric acid transporter
MKKKKNATPTAATRLRPEDERMPIGRSFAYGLQHVLTMYGGIIAPPIIIGVAAHMSASDIALLITSCLFMGGLATLLQTIGVPFFGSKLPLVQGVSFAGVATMIAIVTGGGGITGVFGSVLAAGVIGLIITPFFAQIVRFFPPVVTGVVITVIGLTLMPVAASWTMGGDSGAKDYGAPANIGLAALTLAIVLLLSKVGIATISRLSILLAMVIGTVIAYFFGMADFSNVGDGPIAAFPVPFAFGMPTFPIAGVISMVIVILVTLTETTADILAVGEIVETKIDRKRIADGLRADMLSSTISPIFNSFTMTAFAQNVGLVAITKIKSRYAVAAGGVILILLGLLPVLGRVVAALPYPVLGGAGLVLFGSVAAAGIRTLSRVDFRNSMNLIIVAASLATGLLPIVMPSIYAKFPAWFTTIFDSGISAAALMAILLNILFNHMRRGNSNNPSVIGAGVERRVDVAVTAALAEGDHFADGKLLDTHGIEVPTRDVSEPETESDLR